MWIIFLGNRKGPTGRIAVQECPLERSRYVNTNEDLCTPVAKSVWTDADFGQMGWHDCAVHGLAMEPGLDYPGRVLIDLDYIVDWIRPTKPGGPFTFCVAPATLVFFPAQDIVANIEFKRMTFTPSLREIRRVAPEGTAYPVWHLDGHEFEIVLRAGGFRQYLRHATIRTATQRLSLEQRDGINFDEVAFSGRRPAEEASDPPTYKGPSQGSAS
jgi:hypothetical protein